METKFGSSFNLLVGLLMHIGGISHPDSSYACMRFFGCMACTNTPNFKALHHTLAAFIISFISPSCTLPNLHPLLVKHYKCFGLKVTWNILGSDCGDEVTTFIDADHA
jgi:hypothetical protein